MQVSFDNPADGPAPAGQYSQVARIDLGTGVLLILSGQAAVDEQGNAAFPGDMKAQSELIFNGVAKLLAAHGATLADVVNIRTYVTDLADLPAHREVRARYFPGTPPTSSLVEVSGLFKPGLVLEVDITAAVRTVP